MTKKHKKVIGYTTGVFDLFHVGHLSILKNAKALCDTLVVGCSSDELVKKHKNKTPVIPYIERSEILQAIPYVDVVVMQEEDTYLDKYKAWENYKFDVMFVGSDWQGTEKWNKIEEKFKKIEVKIVYFPYTKTTSSTKINAIINKYR